MYEIGSKVIIRVSKIVYNEAYGKKKNKSRDNEKIPFTQDQKKTCYKTRDVS